MTKTRPVSRAEAKRIAISHARRDVKTAKITAEVWKNAVNDAKWRLDEATKTFNTVVQALDEAERALERLTLSPALLRVLAQEDERLRQEGLRGWIRQRHPAEPQIRKLTRLGLVKSGSEFGRKLRVIEITDEGKKLLAEHEREAKQSAARTRRLKTIRPA